MALIPKLGVNLLEDSPLTTNINFLSPLEFRFQLNRAPNVMYFCQAVDLPTLSINEAVQPTAHVNIPHPGDKVTYEPLSMRFRVDENMTNYLEIHDWIVALGHPENFNQYKNLDEKVSDGSIIILNSNNNPKVRVTFQNMFPLSLSPLNFDTTQTDIEYLEAEATFRYLQFKVEPL